MLTKSVGSPFKAAAFVQNMLVMSLPSKCAVQEFEKHLALSCGKVCAVEYTLLCHLPRVHTGHDFEEFPRNVLVIL